MNKMEVILGDITVQKVDAIVNAANNRLLGGGGVDGAIHHAAGHELLEECKKLNGCPTGEAKITKGYNLPVKWIIHTVGPVWKGGSFGEDDLLAACYRNSFKLVIEKKIKSVAFPSISTGAYRFPVERAVKIAVSETKEFLNQNNEIERVLFVCFDEKTYKLYQDELKDEKNQAKIDKERIW